MSPGTIALKLQAVGSSIEEVAEITACNQYGNVYRKPENVTRRHEIARRLRESGMSYPEIAAALGYRSHATVYHALRTRTTNIAE